MSGSHAPFLRVPKARNHRPCILPSRKFPPSCGIISGRNEVIIKQTSRTIYLDEHDSLPQNLAKLQVPFPQKKKKKLTKYNLRALQNDKTEQPSSIFLHLHGSIGASPQSGEGPAPLRSASPMAAGKSRPRPSQVPASPAFENQKQLFDLITTSLVSQQAVLLHCNPATTLQANINPTSPLLPGSRKLQQGPPRCSPCSPNGLHTPNSSPLALVCHLPLSLQSSVGRHLPGGASLQSRTKAEGQAVTHSLWTALWAHPSSRDTDMIHERLHVLSSELSHPQQRHRSDPCQVRSISGSQPTAE